MKFFASALTDHVDDGAAIAAVLGLIVIQKYFYFGNRVETDGGRIAIGTAVVLTLLTVDSDGQGAGAYAADVGYG